MAAQAPEGPPVQFAVRAKRGLVAYENVGPSPQPARLSAAGSVAFEYSPDGRLAAVVDAQAVTVYDAASGAVKATIARPGVAAISFSPQGRFLVTWERPADGAKGSEDGAAASADARKADNLIVWDTATGAQAASFFQKSLSRENWPTLRWREDESVAGRMVTNEVQFYDGQRIAGGITARLKLANVDRFELSPGPSPGFVAVCVPEKKGAPANVRIYAFGKFDDKDVIASKSAYKADRIELKWNSVGTALLVVTHTDVDTSGKSYYGETGLYFLSSDGKAQLNVPLQKEGPIHDVQWNPTGKEFVAVHGFTPAKMILYDFTCRPTFDFGAAPRNVALWAPHGRFLCFGGFGNLQGDVDFWDRYKLKKMGSCNASCAVQYTWSPDSRHFLTGVLHPRMRVDNGVKVFKYNGALEYHERFDEAYQVAWRPAPPNTYPDRPQSPKPRGAAEAEAPAPAAAPAAPGRYVPPHLRGQQRETPSIFARPDESPGGKILNKPAGPEAPPGASEASKIAEKNKKKREAKKKARETGKGADSGDEAGSAAGGSSPAPVPAAPAPAPAAPADPAAELEKKIKAVGKKLRQISELREGAKAGKALLKEQEEKLAAEPALQAELKGLEAQLAALKLKK